MHHVLLGHRSDLRGPRPPTPPSSGIRWCCRRGRSTSRSTRRRASASCPSWPASSAPTPSAPPSPPASTRAPSVRAVVDIGTNGEVVMGTRERLMACSAPAGPALEGAQIRHGMRGAVGAIDRVWVEDGDLRFHVIGEAPPQGICGSGLIDAVAAALDVGLVDWTGLIQIERRDRFPAPLAATARRARRGAPADPRAPRGGGGRRGDRPDAGRRPPGPARQGRDRRRDPDAPARPRGPGRGPHGPHAGRRLRQLPLDPRAPCGSG